MIDMHVFDTRTDAAEALAAVLAERLRTAIAERGQATMVVSGGTSPRETFERLAATDLDWSRVTIVPSDERWVAPDHPDSNEAMLRDTLRVDRAASARLVGLYRDTPHPADALTDVAAVLAELPDCFDAVVLGMGADGHTASLFPDAANIADCLASPAPCVVPERPAGQTPRLSLSAPRLLTTRALDLLFFGADKRRVFDTARTPGDAAELPVRRVLHAAHLTTGVYWSE